MDRAASPPARQERRSPTPAAERKREAIRYGVKIAGTFVERILTENRCRVIVTRVVEMAHDPGLRVAAEGIEKAEQRSVLLDLGGDLLQGFLFHPPLPPDELARLLAAGSPREGP